MESNAMSQPLAQHHQDALKAAGINWDTIKNLPWDKILAIIEALLAAAKTSPTAKP